MLTVRKIALGMIRGYQLALSPLLGPRCRFYPSCSCYAHAAIEQFGVRAWCLARPASAATLSSLCRGRLRPCADKRLINAQYAHAPLDCLRAILFLNYQVWIKDYQAPAFMPGASQSAGPAGQGSTLGDSVPQAAAPAQRDATDAIGRRPAHRAARRRHAPRFGCGNSQPPDGRRRCRGHDALTTLARRHRCSRHPDQSQGRRTRPGRSSGISAAQRYAEYSRQTPGPRSTR